ncbi:MAG: hypothetical protein KAW89_09255 [Armatimonadetes bacterium]|nr:hypothetical protein [Armatimonadota bacterium]
MIGEYNTDWFNYGLRAAPDHSWRVDLTLADSRAIGRGRAQNGPTRSVSQRDDYTPEDSLAEGIGKIDRIAAVWQLSTCWRPF